MPDEVIFQSLGEHGPTVLIPFSGPHCDGILLKVNILYAQHQAFLKAEAAAIDEHRHEPGGAREMVKNGLDLSHGKHYRQMSPLPAPDSTQLVINILLYNMPVEEHDSIQRLVLRGRRTLFFHGQATEKILEIPPLKV